MLATGTFLTLSAVCTTSFENQSFSVNQILKVLSSEMDPAEIRLIR